MPIPFTLANFGRLGRIRTITGRALNAVPLPLGYEPMVFVVRFELTRNTALDRMRLPVAPHERYSGGCPGI